MTTEEMNQQANIRTTREVVRKLKLVGLLRGNGESLGIVVGALVDKELKRLGMKGNNDE